MSNTSNHTTTGYVPGVCNINTAEVAYRRKAGFIMLAISLAAAMVVFLLGRLAGWSPLVRVVLYFPVFITAVCFLQVKYKFCVSYGAAGKQHAAEGDAETQAIIDEAAKQLDLKRTRAIKLQAALIAFGVTLVLVAVPL